MKRKRRTLTEEAADAGHRAMAPQARQGELRLRIEYLDPRTENPRRNDAAAKKLAVLIEEHGFGQPVTMREEDGIVYKGNTRVKAAIILGLAHIPVMRRSYPVLQDAVDDAIADNVAGGWSEFDEDLLFDALEKRDKITTEALSRRTGLEQVEIEALREPPKESEPRAAPPPSARKIRCPHCGEEWEEEA